MKRFTLIALVLCAVSISCNDADKSTDQSNDKMSTSDSAGNTTSSNTSKPSSPPMDSAAMMQKWMEYATPGTPHQLLAKANGTWHEDVTMWMEPGAPPSKSTATAVNKMVLGGRYQESKHTGSFDGMPFEGMSTLGYDKAKNVFQTTWIDNMGTGTMFLEGPWDSTKNIITFTGKSVDPMTGDLMDIRQILTLVDDNNQKVEMYCNRNGSEYKSMEITLKRK